MAFKSLIQMKVKAIKGVNVSGMCLSVVNLTLMTIICFLLWKLVSPYERGFHCDDQSITKPYFPVTITMPYLLLLSFTIPAIFISVTESRLKSKLEVILSKIKQFYFGFVFTFILVLLCKTYFGRLRPNSINGLCNASHYCQSESQFVPHFVCNNPIPKLVKESRMSFYSGHSSVGTYSAVYIILYLYYRLKSESKSLIVVQMCVLLIGLIPGLTQGINYWHHWSDIATGFGVGGLTAYLIINYV